MMTDQNALAFIVEDDPELGDIFEFMLQSVGIDTQSVKDGRAAIARLATIKPDIILLDINLPYISGIEVLAAVRTLPHLKEILVVMVTANPHAAMTIEDQVDLVLVKPVSFTETRVLVQRLLEGRKINISVSA